MEQLSKRIKSLGESQTIAMNQKSKDLQAQGINVINLTVGEPDFFTPPHVKEAAKKAIDENYSFYTAVNGYPELLKAIATKFKNENNLDYKPEQIMVTNGAKHALANAIMCLIDEGDEVIIPAPYWVSYAELVKLAQGNNVILPTSLDTNYKITPEQLEKAITPNTKALLLCSPSNPTGSLYNRKEMQALVNVLVKYPRIFVISDEIYEHINFVGKHVSVAEFPEIKERCVIINGVSKGYAMTGYRIGYMAAPLWLTKACSKLQGQMTTNASTIAQRAAITALTAGNEYTLEMNKAFRRRRDLVLGLMKDIPGLKCNVPDGAFYVFPDVSYYFGKSDGTVTIKDDMDFCLYLLDKASVATVPGGAFGDPRCIRISYANSDEILEKALIQMKEALAKLK
ncbi:MAG: pyridoxal phosphate-dependent aminotransferase [Bacteroidota bacterium]|nr:pyridoxal phosphate-dependent aminotransferase [Bacteroidota bacterium]